MFDNNDCEIKSQIIPQCTSAKVRRKALSEPGMSLHFLNQLLEYGKALEQAASIEKQEIKTLQQKIQTGRRNWNDQIGGPWSIPD